VGSPKNTVALNGKIYDVVSGALVSKLPTFDKITKTGKFQKRPVHINQSNKAIDGFMATKKIPGNKAHRDRHNITQLPRVKRSISNTMHHKPQHAKTLMRAIVRNPAKSEKPKVKRAHGPVPAIQAATSVAGSRAGARAKRSVAITKSKHVIKFAHNHTQIIKKMIPLSVKSPEIITPIKKTKSSVKAANAHSSSQPSIKLTGSLLTKSINHNAHNDEEVQLKKPRHKTTSLLNRAKPHKKSSKILLSVLAVAVVGGVLVWHFLPQLQIRLASIKAGFSAALPGYEPAGFDRKAINYQSGEVTLNYKSNTDERNFAIRQSASNWNSETLLDNFVQPKQKPYQTYQEQGKTIYIYDEADAAWVSGGVMYEVIGNSSLNNDQLLKIADSL